MSKYKVEYTPAAIRQIRNLDGATRKLMRAWIEKNLVDCEDPRAHGKGLSGDRSGQWRYRIGDYRLLANILDDRIVIQVFKIGHRRFVYKK